MSKFIDWLKSIFSGGDKPEPSYNRQLVIVGINHHDVWPHWSESRVMTLCKKLAGWGVRGVGIEIAVTHLPATAASVKADADRQIEKAGNWIAASRKCGLICKITGVNSNDVANPHLPAEVFTQRVNQIKAKYGTRNILWQSMSEDDNNTAEGVRNTVRVHDATVWPLAQLLDMDPHHTGAGWRETHLQHTGDVGRGLPRSPHSLCVTDSGAVLSNNNSDATMIGMAKRNLDAGYSFECYGFDTSERWALYEALGGLMRGRP